MIQTLIIMLLAAGLVLLMRSLLAVYGEDAAGHPVLLGMSALVPFTLLWAAEATSAGPELTLADPIVMGFFCVSMMTGGLAWGSVRRGLIPRGAAAGLLAAGCGYCAYRWVYLGPALFGDGVFAAGVLGAGLPALLAGSTGLASGALLHEDLRRYRWGVPLVLAGLWGFSAHSAEKYLRAELDFGYGTLTQAAGVRPADQAPTQRIAILVPGPSGDSYIESRVLADENSSLGRIDLLRIQRYLHDRRYMSLFLKQGIAAERQGWLLHWDEEEALRAMSLNLPGDIHPDYRGALALIRSGPLTEDRYLRLEGLARQAKASPKGFESIGQSQFIYEAFSAGYARFGDHEKAREWLLKVYDLWPLFEKEVAMPTVEYMRNGIIAGSVMMDGSPAVGAVVGLFFTAQSTGPYFALNDLCCSKRLDESGKFRFRDLGQGEYYLAIRMSDDSLGGEVLNSPGFISLSPESTRARLGPIWIEPRRGPRPFIGRGKKPIMRADEADRALKDFTHPARLRGPHGTPR